MGSAWIDLHLVQICTIFRAFQFHKKLNEFKGLRGFALCTFFVQYLGHLDPAKT